MGKSTINGPFSMAMLNYQRVFPVKPFPIADCQLCESTRGSIIIQNLKELLWIFSTQDASLPQVICQCSCARPTPAFWHSNSFYPKHRSWGRSRTNLQSTSWRCGWDVEGGSEVSGKYVQCTSFLSQPILSIAPWAHMLKKDVSRSSMPSSTKRQ